MDNIIPIMSQSHTLVIAVCPKNVSDEFVIAPDIISSCKLGIERLFCLRPMLMRGHLNLEWVK